MTRILARTRDPATAQRLVSDFQARGGLVGIHLLQPVRIKEVNKEHAVRDSKPVYILVVAKEPPR